MDEKCIQNFRRKTWRKGTTPEDLGVDGKIILLWVCGQLWTGFIWLRIRISGGIFWTR
jgi:hypothetical protein